VRAPSELHPGSTRVVRLITRLNIGGPARQALMLTRELRPEYETLLARGLTKGNSATRRLRLGGCRSFVPFGPLRI
jgi:hypothetical protein